MHQNVRDFKEKRICVDEVIDYIDQGPSLQKLRRQRKRELEKSNRQNLNHQTDLTILN